jgi:5-methylcytosine-specific restriction endonuclease McrA
VARIVICKDCGEEKPHYAKGLCKRCYMRQYHEEHPVRNRKGNLTHCAECGRNRLHYAHGLCRQCYDRQRHKKYYEEHHEELTVYKRQYNKAHREEIAAYNQQHYEDHREERLAYQQQYREDHREEILAYDQQYYAEHREEFLAYHRQYDAEHRKEARERSRQWAKANPDKAREKDRRRRARKNGATIALVDEAAIYELYDNRCVYCGTTEDLTLDHVIPLAGSGAHSEDNLVVACRSCNASKNARPLEEWLETQPHSQAWVM